MINIAVDVASGFLRASYLVITLGQVDLRCLAVLLDSIVSPVTLLVSDHAKETEHNAEHYDHENGHDEHKSIRLSRICFFFICRDHLSVATASKLICSRNKCVICFRKLHAKASQLFIEVLSLF